MTIFVPLYVLSEFLFFTFLELSTPSPYLEPIHFLDPHQMHCHPQLSLMTHFLIVTNTHRCLTYILNAYCDSLEWGNNIIPPEGVIVRIKIKISLCLTLLPLIFFYIFMYNRWIVSAFIQGQPPTCELYPISDPTQAPPSAFAPSLCCHQVFPLDRIMFAVPKQAVSHFTLKTHLMLSCPSPATAIGTDNHCFILEFLVLVWRPTSFLFLSSLLAGPSQTFLLFPLRLPEL